MTLSMLQEFGKCVYGVELFGYCLVVGKVCRSLKTNACKVHEIE